MTGRKPLPQLIRGTYDHGMVESQSGTPGPSMSVERDAIGAAIGRIPSGCAILTVRHGPHATGVLVSWVQQASFDPPAISVALRKGRPAVELVEQSGRFLLNIIGANATPMFRHFGRGFGLADDAFAGLQTTPTDYGTRLNDCIAALGCKVVQKTVVGDHDLYIATVKSAIPPAAGEVPYVHLRGSGFNY